MAESVTPQPPTEQEVREALAAVYHPVGVDIWLNAPHRMLDGEKAIDLIERGEGDRVMQVIEQLTTGAFG